MNILRRHVHPLGFKGSGPFVDSSFESIWYRSFPKANTVIGISNYGTLEGVFCFKLSPANMKAFEKGKLSLTPPGCCHATGGRAISRYQWVHKGIIKNQRELHTALATTGLFPECQLPQKNGKNSSPKKTPKRCSSTTSTKP